MIIVNYKSKRKLKKAIGKLLKCTVEGQNGLLPNGHSFFVTNYGGTYKATVTLVDGIITEVR